MFLQILNGGYKRDYFMIYPQGSRKKLATASQRPFPWHKYHIIIAIKVDEARPQAGNSSNSLEKRE